jgi:hypothetical protein
MPCAVGVTRASSRKSSPGRSVLAMTSLRSRRAFALDATEVPELVDVQDFSDREDWLELRQHSLAGPYVPNWSGGRCWC